MPGQARILCVPQMTWEDEERKNSGKHIAVYRDIANFRFSSLKISGKDNEERLKTISIENNFDLGPIGKIFLWTNILSMAFVVNKA